MVLLILFSLILIIVIFALAYDNVRLFVRQVISKNYLSYGKDKFQENIFGTKTCCK